MSPSASGDGGCPHPLLARGADSMFYVSSLFCLRLFCYAFTLGRGRQSANSRWIAGNFPLCAGLLESLTSNIAVIVEIPLDVFND